MPYIPLTPEEEADAFATIRQAKALGIKMPSIHSTETISIPELKKMIAKLQAEDATWDGKLAAYKIRRRKAAALYMVGASLSQL